MEAYLEALDVGILRVASQSFPKPQDATHLQGDEVNYENGMQMLETPSLEAFAKMCSIE